MQKVDDFFLSLTPEQKRVCRVLQNVTAARVRLDGKTCINFSSNDYLGLSTHSEVVKAASAAIKKYGTGSRASRLISGTLTPHQKLENSLAELKKTQSALVYSSGYMANVGVISALIGVGDAVIMDRLNHASLFDAAKLSGARIFVYDHCNVESLKKVLDRTRAYERLVVTDSVFSMDGDFAPLSQIVDLCKKSGATLMIDEAHATGILGARGIGLPEQANVLGQVDIVVGTLSKALGAQGGFVCASQKTIDFLINKSRAFIYTTALSPALCAASQKALEIIKKNPQLFRYALDLSQDFRLQLFKYFPDVCRFNPKENSLIVPLVLGDSARALKISQALLAYGIYAPAVRPPTVPKGESRLRFSITAAHKKNDIKKTIKILQQVLK